MPSSSTTVDNHDDETTTTSSALLREASMFHTSTTSVGGLSPARSTELLELFLPAELAFFRQPASREEGEQGQIIFNPVSTTDVQHAVRAALAGHAEARRVEVEALDIAFAGGEEEVRRVGEVGVEICVPDGGGREVKRVVRVVAQDGGA